MEFDVFGLDHIAMVTGRVTANVPPQAIGFRIDTPDMEVVDLGTEFALKVDSSGKSRLVVLEGEVEARLKKGMNNENYPLIIAKDRLEELDRSPSYLEKVYDPESFAPSPVRDELIRATGGMIHSLQDRHEICDMGVLSMTISCFSQSDWILCLQSLFRLTLRSRAPIVY